MQWGCVCNFVFRNMREIFGSLQRQAGQSFCDSDGCYEQIGPSLNSNQEITGDSSGFKGLVMILTVLLVLYGLLTVLGRNERNKLTVKPIDPQDNVKERDSAL